MRLNLPEGQLQRSIGMTETENLSHRDTGRIPDKVGKLLPGQTFQGEVVSRNGNQIQLLLGKDTLLEAHLNQSMNLEIGRIFTFEVRNNGKSLTLSPLFANTANQANALKALEMAGLPVHAGTVEMTDKMMEAGLSIDRNSLQQMFQKMNAFSKEDVSNLVLLTKMNLPITRENLTQMEAYRNLTHQMIRGVEDIVEQLTAVFQDEGAISNPEGTAKLMLSLLEQIENQIEKQIEKQIEEQIGNGEETGGGFSGGGVSGGNLSDSEIPKFLGPEGQIQEGQIQENQIQESQIQDDQGQKMKMQESLTQEFRAIQPENTESEALFSSLGEDAADHMIGKIRTELANALAEKDWGKLKELTTDKTIQKFLADRLIKQWTLEPAEVSEKGKISEFYEKVSRQLKTLAQGMEQNGHAETAVYKSITNMQESLDFLHQINQNFTYVQLPLRLQQGNTHGELYVYTNKKNLAASDGQISALLHLDMEHLGPVDVYVAMQSEKVQTRFFVQDDDMLGFLEQHMDLLTQRLEKRGYHCGYEMQVRNPDAATSGLGGLQVEQKGTMIAQYAFDVRA